MDNHYKKMDIQKICQTIFQQLGQGHNECVYQKALVLEMYNTGARSVESEKQVPVFYTDTNNVQHTIGSERIDILVRFKSDIILIELKATIASPNDANLTQLKKYVKGLLQIGIIATEAVIINFSQKKDVNQVEFNKLNIL
jgi:GxxExxY protein